MKKPPNLIGTEKENQLFKIDKKTKNFSEQKRKKTRGKPILDFIAN